MDYAEYPVPPKLDGLVKAIWSLAGAGPSAEWTDHDATPDGCMELIARQSGRSRWGEAQPPLFAVGLSEAPVRFSFSGDAAFVGLRLWPWAWTKLSEVPLAALRGRWLGVAEPAFATPAEAAQCALEALGSETALAATGRALVAADSVEGMAVGTGMAPRALQRWFARHVGLPPRRYLRLLRFQKAFEGLPGSAALAGHAADHGFADQAHMAREFRALAGQPAVRARRRASGPFLR